MTTGERIKEYRVKSSLTQKDLADQLNVTAQAVSRWEQDIVEPSIETLKKMAEIFVVSLDQLLSNNKAATDEKSIERTIEKNNPEIDTRRTIGVCEECNKVILEGQPIHRHRVTRTEKKIICESCEQIRVEKEKKIKISKTKKFRFKGFFWAIVIGGFFGFVAVNNFLVGTMDAGDLAISILFSYSVFAFLFTINAKNTFINDFFWEITSWGFVKLPGIIFTLDFDGLLFLIFAKVLLFFIGIGIAVVAGSIALMLSLVLAMFTFPFSVFYSFTKPERTRLD
jgi:transcriptional regulator with XRE-family HTH domain